jgi:hypothetical protein
MRSSKSNGLEGLYNSVVTQGTPRRYIIKNERKYMAKRTDKSEMKEQLRIKINNLQDRYNKLINDAERVEQEMETLTKVRRML